MANVQFSKMSLPSTLSGSILIVKVIRRLQGLYVHGVDDCFVDISSRGMDEKRVFFAIKSKRRVKIGSP